ncbi:TPA: glycosyltransferase [Vibrio metschnikovii]
MLLRKASKLFTQGNYEKALDLYIQYEKQYGNDNVSVNIKLCQSRIREQISKHIHGNEKTNISKVNDYFDHVYLVNLPHKHENRLKTAKHLTGNEICFEVFNAINGYEGESFCFFEKYKKKPIGQLKRYPKYSCLEVDRNNHLIESAGAIGYIQTYIKILEDAKSKGYKRFLILEDDVLLHDSFNDKFSKFINSVDENWKVLLLGASQYGWENINEDIALENNYYYPGRTSDSSSSTCGSFAIAFDYSVIDEVIEAQKSFEAPFDHLPMSEIYEKYVGKCFVAYPNIIIPDVTNSSIRSGRDQFKHGKKMKWEVERFDFPIKKPSIAIIISGKTNIRYLESFSKASEMPFNLMLYINTEDGLRPLHNKDLLDLNINENKLISTQVDVYLETDYAATLSEYDILSESEIIKFIEYKLGITTDNFSILSEIIFKQRSIVRDRVSVIIPTYKRPNNLYNALISVLDQDYDDIEVIVVNDNGLGSDFNVETIDLVNNINNPVNRVRIINHKVNRNGSAARNTGIMASTGEYICFLDDDDIYLPGRISESIKEIKYTSYNIGAVYCGFLGWNSPENDLNRYKEGDLTLDILMLEYKNHYLHTNTATYKREAILAINGFDESYPRHQDLEFNLRFFEKYKINSVNKVLVKLNPEVSEISNKLFNEDMLKLKDKFLSSFSYKIETQSGYQEKIYLKHWCEVIRYITDKKSIYNHIFSDYRNPACLLKYLE